jgi:hypothetical protein
MSRLWTLWPLCVMCNVHSVHNNFFLKFTLCEFDGFNRSVKRKLTNIVLPFSSSPVVILMIDLFW